MAFNSAFKVLIAVNDITPVKRKQKSTQIQYNLHVR